MDSANLIKRDSLVQATELGDFYVSYYIMGYTNVKELSGKLPQLDGELAHEMKRLDDVFWIGRQKLKEVVKRFGVHRSLVRTTAASAGIGTLSSIIDRNRIRALCIRPRAVLMLTPVASAISWKLMSP